MKYSLALIIIMIGLFVSMLYPVSATTTEDLGTPSILESACHFTQNVGEAQNLLMGSCRADGEVIYRHGGRAAIVPVIIRVNGEWRKLSIYMVKSIWNGSTLSERE